MRFKLSSNHCDSSKDKEGSFNSDSEDENEEGTQSPDQPSFSGGNEDVSLAPDSDQIPGTEQRSADDTQIISNAGAELDGVDGNSSPPLKKRKK